MLEIGQKRSQDLPEGVAQVEECLASKFKDLEFKPQYHKKMDWE
jgi:hypothetical protein